MLHISAEEQKAAAAGAARRPDQVLEVQPRPTSTSAALWPAYREAYEIALERTNTEIAPWYVDPQPTRSGTATSRSASCCSRRCAGWPCSWPEADFDVEEQRAPAARARTRSGDPHRLASPATSRRCARAAACPASSRPTTSAPTSASSAAPARACGCWSPRWSSASWPGGSACPPRGWSGSTWTRRSPATRPTRRSRTCSTPAPASTSGVDFLPGAFGYDGDLPDRRRRRRQGALARRLHRQRRPHLAQPQPAGLARRALGDRPRRRAVLPPRLGRRRHRPRPVRPPAVGPRRPRASRRTPAGWRRPTRSRRPARARTCSPRCWPRCPTCGSSRCRARTTPDAVRPAYVAFLAARLGHPPVAARGRPEAPHDQARLPVRRPALRAARRPRGVRQRRRGPLLPGRRLPRGRAGASTATGCAPSTRGSTSTRSCEALSFVEGVCAGDERGGAAADKPIGTRFGFLKAPRAPCSSPARSTAASPPTRPASSSTCWPPSSAASR